MGAVPATTGEGLGDNVAGALAYLVIPAIIWLVIAPYKDRPFVRFHSWQAIFLLIARIAISILFTILWSISGFVGVILVPLEILVSIGFLILWIVLIVKTYSNQTLELPVIGPMARQQAGKMG